MATIPALAPYLLGYLAVVSFPAYLPILLELVRDMDVNLECLATVQWGQLDGPVDMLEELEEREWPAAAGTAAKESGVLSLVHNRQSGDGPFSAVEPGQLFYAPPTGARGLVVHRS